MRQFKFKSLTMRIWATFTFVILLITICLSLIYLYFFRYIDTRAKAQDLTDAHTLLLESNFDDPMRFDVFRNLRGVSHFIVSDGSVIDIMRPPTGRVPVHDMDRGSQLFERGNGTPQLPRSLHLSQFDILALRNWIAEYATDDMNKNTFYQKYDGVDIIFTISSTEDNDFFISYMPVFYDNSMMHYMLAISGLFIIVGFIVAKIIANYISKPLSELEKFTLKIAAKDWNEPIIIKNIDEIGRLATSMNQMQEALKRADEEEKVFLQSISHDLKTPVMVIMSHADAIIDGVYVDTLDKTAQIIKDEAINLSKKIKALLYLNTLDFVLGNESEISDINLDEIIKHIVERFEMLGGHLVWHIDIEPVVIKGNCEKLTIAIENILDNAIRYAKSNISISVKKCKKTVYVEIFNDGDHIKPENLDKIFNSLYKDKKGNFGLGLAISKKIVSFYGGNIFAENNEKGVSVIMNFPVINHLKQQGELKI